MAVHLYIVIRFYTSYEHLPPSNRARYQDFRRDHKRCIHTPYQPPTDIPHMLIQSSYAPLHVHSSAKELTITFEGCQCRSPPLNRRNHAGTTFPVLPDGPTTALILLHTMGSWETLEIRRLSLPNRYLWHEANSNLEPLARSTLVICLDDQQTQA